MALTVARYHREAAAPIPPLLEKAALDVYPSWAVKQVLSVQCEYKTTQGAVEEAALGPENSIRTSSRAHTCSLGFHVTHPHNETLFAHWDGVQSRTLPMPSSNKTTPCLVMSGDAATWAVEGHTFYP